MLLYPSSRFDFGAQTVQQFFSSDRVRSAISPLPISSLHSSVLWDACYLFTLPNGTTQHLPRQRGWKGIVKVSVAPCQQVKGTGRKASKPATGSAVTIESAACLSPIVAIAPAPATTFANARSSNRRAAPTIERAAWLSLAKLEPSIEQGQLHSSCAPSLKWETAMFQRAATTIESAVCLSVTKTSRQQTDKVPL